MSTNCRACKRIATHIATTILGDIPYCSYHANKRLRENICVGKITKIPTSTKTDKQTEV